MKTKCGMNWENWKPDHNKEWASVVNSTVLEAFESLKKITKERRTHSIAILSK